MNKFTIYILLLFFGNFVFAQQKETVYFETNSHQLLLPELNKLDLLFKNKNIKVSKVIGYCDERSNNLHNDSLGLNRATFVANIIKKISNNVKFEILSKGENFSQEKNLALNRKVEIYYELETEKKSTKLPLTEDLTLKTKIAKSKIGDKIVLQNLNFFNKLTTLMPESKVVLEELLNVLKNNIKLEIELQGHICCTPGKDSEGLALKRCQFIYDYLVKNGIAGKRMKYKSFDATKPIYAIPEKNDKERLANRRVEILITKK